MSADVEEERFFVQRKILCGNPKLYAESALSTLNCFCSSFLLR